MKQKVNIQFRNGLSLKDFQKDVATATGLAGKSETYALEVIGNIMWTRVRDYFLTYANGTYWVRNLELQHTEHFL